MKERLGICHVTKKAERSRNADSLELTTTAVVDSRIHPNHYGKRPGDGRA